MKTWVLCLSRRKAVEWMIRSRSRWKQVRVSLSGSGWKRPRLFAGSLAYGQASGGRVAYVVIIAATPTGIGHDRLPPDLMKSDVLGNDRKSTRLNSSH